MNSTPYFTPLKKMATDTSEMGTPASDENRASKPVVPLPNPGEGGPVYPGNGNNNNTPMIPLPNPGEGGPVYPGSGNMEGTPVIPLPNPGEGGPVYPGNTFPGFPWPGGNQPTPPTVGTLIPSIIGTIISSYPRPTEPCNFCVNGTGRTSRLRFLNAAVGYNPFVVFVNQNVFVNSLSFSEVTDYERVSSGSQMITVMGENGYIYIQKLVNIPANSAVTIAIINTASGLDLLLIEDVSCNRNRQMSCVRVANLSPNSGPLTVDIGNQYVTFDSVQ